MEENKKDEKFEIHYYFDDKSHSMDAFLRNKMEKDLLEAIYRVGLICEREIKIESEAFQEGGLKEVLKTTVISSIPFFMYFQPSINEIATQYFTSDPELRELQKEKIREEIKAQKLSNKEREFTLENLEAKLLDDRQIKRSVSNFYKRVDSYPKVKKIGFKNLDNNNEIQVEKTNFSQFVLKDNIDVLEDEDAMIEILSPILKEAKDKWKGIYNSEKVIFSMGDSDFKKGVIKGKYKFSNGSKILCLLKIKIVYDEFGSEKKRYYSVQKVFATIESSSEDKLLTNHGIVKKKKDWNDKHQSTLYDFLDDKL